MKTFGHFIFVCLILMAVFVKSDDLPNDTAETERSMENITAEDLIRGKPISETDKVNVADRISSENDLQYLKGHMSDELAYSGRGRDVSMLRTNQRERFHERPRRGITDLPSPEKKDHNNDMNSNSGHSECYLCPAGPPGRVGPPGIPGRHGYDGLPGRIGVTGDPGRPGRDGRDGVTGSCGDIRGRSANPATPETGVIFTRWGATTCPSTSQLVYNGVSVGSFYNNKGGTADILCLPDTPQYSFTASGKQVKRSVLVNVEYDTAGFRPAESVHNHAMPCSVCMAPGRAAKLMVPGRKTCPSSDWTLEYSGYLQSTRKDWFRTATICLDEFPEAIPGTEGNDSGAELVHIEYKCNELCGDYTNGFELTCAVCTI